MKEWVIRKEELRSGKITKDEYFEWKINWPHIVLQLSRQKSKLFIMN